MGSFDCSFSASFDVDPTCTGGAGGGNFCCDGFDCLTQDPFACTLS